MEIENKVYSIAEMKEREIFTADYSFMDTPCIVTGTLVLKAQARGKMLHLFFRLEDGSKIITVVYWWQKYLGFYEQPVGSTFLLRYVKNSKSGVHLDSAELLSGAVGNATVQGYEHRLCVAPKPGGQRPKGENSPVTPSRETRKD